MKKNKRYQDRYQDEYMELQRHHHGLKNILAKMKHPNSKFEPIGKFKRNRKARRIHDNE